MPKPSFEGGLRTVDGYKVKGDYAYKCKSGVLWLVTTLLIKHLEDKGIDWENPPVEKPQK